MSSPSFHPREKDASDGADANFVATPPTTFALNPFQAIGEEWYLITAGTPDRFNTMTASWGAMGVLWNKPILICFVRPSRHTFGFMERSERFTASFFEPSWRPVLNFCGTHSGRDIDKIAHTGLRPFTTAAGGIAFEQARLILTCARIYEQDLDAQRLPESVVAACYPRGDVHRFFIGEIVECLVRSTPGATPASR